MWWAEECERLSVSCPETIVRTRRPAGIASVVCTERTVDARELAGGQVTVSLKVEGVDWRLPIRIKTSLAARQLLALALALISLRYNLIAHVLASQNSTCMRNGEMCLCDIFTLDMYVNNSCARSKAEDRTELSPAAVQCNHTPCSIHFSSKCLTEWHT